MRHFHRYRRHADPRRRDRTGRAGRAAARCSRAACPVIAITGRPMGWSEPFARHGRWPRSWPRTAPWRCSATALRCAPNTRRTRPRALRNAARLRAVAAAVLREVPGATLAQDSAGRVTDIAIDHSEFAHLDAAAIARVVAVMQREGLTRHGQLDPHQRLVSASTTSCRARAGWCSGCSVATLDAELDRWVYVGDSTNDQAMFGHFPLSVGVANLRRLRRATAHLAGVPDRRRARRGLRRGGTRADLGARDDMTRSRPLLHRRGAGTGRGGVARPGALFLRACCCRRCGSTSAGAT